MSYFCVRHESKTVLILVIQINLFVLRGTYTVSLTKYCYISTASRTCCKRSIRWKGALPDHYKTRKDKRIGDRWLTPLRFPKNGRLRAGVADSRYESTFRLMLQNSLYLAYRNSEIFHSYLYSATPEFLLQASSFDNLRPLRVKENRYR